MKFWVAITDLDWYESLSSQADLDEVNFWQPTATRRPVNVESGAPVLFKLHARNGGWIVGGGFFVEYIPLPIVLAWETFGEKYGATSLREMVTRVSRYRPGPVEVTGFDVGCSVLSGPFFIEQQNWLPAPHDWKPNIVQGKAYDSDVGEGSRLWGEVRATLATLPTAAVPVQEDRYGRPILVRPRLGQGGFRSVVTTAYERRCVVTGERTLPVLDAAHIRPYAESGPHAPENGLLLRKDLHTLLDKGYVTVTPSLELRVSRRIREQFENGRDYYAMNRQRLRSPVAPYPAPAREYLEWHSDERFLG